MHGGTVNRNFHFWKVIFFDPPASLPDSVSQNHFISLFSLPGSVPQNHFISLFYETGGWQAHRTVYTKPNNAMYLKRDDFSGLK